MMLLVPRVGFRLGGVEALETLSDISQAMRQ